ncbi:MAG: HNH endonuclease [Polyangiaceae bacterium]|nr:HNH endonuclease [Polyangiaceae bacterium]
MPGPSVATLKALFALSSNRCAFADCDHPLVVDGDLVVGEVAHIHARSNGGPRFDPDLPADELHSAANLILLCHLHHTMVDRRAESFPPDKLREIKQQHEAAAELGAKVLSDRVAEQLAAEMAAFWDGFGRLHEAEHPIPELAVPVDPAADAAALFDRSAGSIDFVWKTFNGLREASDALPDFVAEQLNGRALAALSPDELAVFNGRLSHWAFEYLALALPNTIIDIDATIRHLEILHFDLVLRLDPSDQQARRRVDAARERVLEYASSKGYFD